jgi:D-alanyl-D-alanine dipeptidase
MKTVTILTLGLALFTACQATPMVENNGKNEQIVIPQESRQLLMVVTDSWSDRKGALQRFEREDKRWIKVGKSIDIILGRNGLGWGIGLHSIPKDAKYIKKEGDGKAPAGLFALGNGFGYDEFKIDFPYSIYTRTDHCVDDSKSEFYNRIIDSTTVKKDYKSFEHMKLKNRLYKYGITVNHNENQVPMAGSCIFIHIRSDNGKGTAGCTAMKESEIVKVLRWIKMDKHPLLLQLPRTEIIKRVGNNSLL